MQVKLSLLFPGDFARPPFSGIHLNQAEVEQPKTNNNKKDAQVPWMSGHSMGILMRLCNNRYKICFNNFWKNPISTFTGNRLSSFPKKTSKRVMPKVSWWCHRDLNLNIIIISLGPVHLFWKKSTTGHIRNSLSHLEQTFNKNSERHRVTSLSAFYWNLVRGATWTWEFVWMCFIAYLFFQFC